jgi:hypothetical protein
MCDATDLSGANGETGSRGISPSVSPLPAALAKLSKATDFEDVYILILSATSAFARGHYFHGHNSNGNSWSGWQDSDGYFYGHDSKGNNWSGWVDRDGYYYGHDSNGTSWSGWTD